MPPLPPIPIISIVVAAAENGVIGRANRLPWRLPEDLAHFKRLTLGHPVVMGRRTHESILAALGRPLPGRTSIVLTRARGRALAGALAVGSLEGAIDAVAGAPELFVIGGAEIYRLALARADRVHLTRIHASFDGDATFPPLDPARWREAWREDHPPRGARTFGFSFLRYERAP
jgi:dihydrofolate reductase